MYSEKSVPLLPETRIFNAAKCRLLQMASTKSSSQLIRINDEGEELLFPPHGSQIDIDNFHDTAPCNGILKDSTSTHRVSSPCCGLALPLRWLAVSFLLMQFIGGPVSQ